MPIFIGNTFRSIMWKRLDSIMSSTFLQCSRSHMDCFENKWNSKGTNIQGEQQFPQACLSLIVTTHKITCIPNWARKCLTLFLQCIPMTTASSISPSSHPIFMVNGFLWENRFGGGGPACCSIPMWSILDGNFRSRLALQKKYPSCCINSCNIGDILQFA